MKQSWFLGTVVTSFILLSGACSGTHQAIPSCGKDTDCLGGRICNEQKRCGEPGPQSAAHVLPSPSLTVPEFTTPDVLKSIPVAGSPPFAMKGGNAQHTGQLAGAAPLKKPKQIWELQFNKAIVGSPTVGPGGIVYVTSHDKKLHAVSAVGKLLWSFETEDRIWSTPAIAQDGTIYTGSDDDHLYAIDGENGTLKWKYRIGRCSAPTGFGPVGTRCDVDGGPTIGPDGSVYVGGDGLYAIWPNGTLRWKFATPEHVRSAPAIGYNGILYIGCLDDAVYAVHPDGTKKWEFRTTRDIESSLSVATDGTVYFGGDDDGIYALDNEGNQKWKVITGGDVRATPAIDKEGTIYIGSYDKKLYALTPSGTVKWRFSAADKIHGAVGIATNDVVLFGSQDDNLYALGKDGKLLWYLPLDADVDPTPSLTQDGTLYVVGDDRKLRAFK